MNDLLSIGSGLLSGLMTLIISLVPLFIIRENSLKIPKDKPFTLLGLAYLYSLSISFIAHYIYTPSTYFDLIVPSIAVSGFVGFRLLRKGRSFADFINYAVLGMYIVYMLVTLIIVRGSA